MDESNPLPLWLRHAMIGLGLFLAGGLFAFGYSYRPLHGAISWQVSELEMRIDERNLENQKLADELARLRSQDAARIDPETFAQVQRDLEKASKSLTQSEKDLERSERKRKEANSSANRWKKRFEELRDQPAPIPASVPAAPLPPPSGSVSPPASGSGSDPAAALKATGPNLSGTALTPGPAPSAVPSEGESGMLPAAPQTIPIQP
jgi:hypothetical protein